MVFIKLLVKFTRKLDIRVDLTTVTELELPVATQLRNEDVRCCYALHVFNVKPKE